MSGLASDELGPDSTNLVRWSPGWAKQKARFAASRSFVMFVSSAFEWNCEAPGSCFFGVDDRFAVGWSVRAHQADGIDLRDNPRPETPFQDDLRLELPFSADVQKGEQLGQAKRASH